MRSTRPSGARRVGSLWVLLVALLFMSWVALGQNVHSKPSSPASLATVRLAELPPEARMTCTLIRAGGPFPYEKDGAVFGNRERLLPPRKRGYYREYTVATPGSSDRGIRRIVCGGAPRAPDVCYYTDDHYMSFRVIVQ